MKLGYAKLVLLCAWALCCLQPYVHAEDPVFCSKCANNKCLEFEESCTAGGGVYTPSNPYEPTCRCCSTCLRKPACCPQCTKYLCPKVDQTECEAEGGTFKARDDSCQGTCQCCDHCHFKGQL